MPGILNINRNFEEGNKEFPKSVVIVSGNSQQKFTTEFLCKFVTCRKVFF